MRCRHCGAPVELNLVDLGWAPPSNAFLTAAELSGAVEAKYPLRVRVCQACWLVQTEDFARPQELFTPAYAYLSGYSRTWIDHVEQYVEAAARRFELDENSFVVELAANDGHLLQFVKARGIPCLGIEPTSLAAAAARARGLDIVEEFFGTDLAYRLAAERRADLIVANNVLAHVPDINDFTAGVALLLEPNGVATFEFAYVRELVESNQFDTIYHEHFSYLSMTSVTHVLETNGLRAFDVQQLPTHGGSLRVFAESAARPTHTRQHRVDQLLDAESEIGMTSPRFYTEFQARVDAAKNEFVTFLETAAGSKKTMAAYGAAAKGNTLLNYAGVGTTLIPFVADANPSKQGKYLPGSHIPIVAERHIRQSQPSFVLILPWNLRTEISAQLRYIAEWEGQFVTAVPSLQVWG